MRRLSWVAAATGVVVLALTPVLGSAGAAPADPTPGIQHVDIYGADHFIRPGRITNDFNFFPQNITVKQGAELGFVNKTAEGHTIVLTPVGDVPHTTQAVFGCSGFGPPDPTAPPTFCAANLNTFFPDPNSNGPPSVAQIDVGIVGTQPDVRAIASNTANGGPPLPPGFALEASFDTAASNGGATDSTIIGSAQPPDQGPSIRTVVVNAAPGTYNYICTIHPWMQGTITVTA